jgi:hypothetical protein
MPAKMKTVFITLVLCVACLSNACSSGIVKRLAEAAKLRQDLMDKYQEKEVNVDLLNSVFLRIAFVNSLLNQQDSDMRSRRAQEAAKFVVKTFPSIEKINHLDHVRSAGNTLDRVSFQQKLKCVCL